ncbi:hypothetical protein FJY63_02335 [Candidatus Sumerlaeota bacterium]|nr:hypothetical protein [Candidatus Sumerlaeota bacterium]
MSLLDAVVQTGPLLPGLSQAGKKRYSEVLSKNLAYEVAAGLRAVGFSSIKPVEGGPGEEAFQGGLGPKKVDVAYSDERHGLLLAVSIKSINAAPYGKNLKNRFADLCTEAITLHLRFPYSVVCALFAFPAGADEDLTEGREKSTFSRANDLFATITGRKQYTDPGEKFEDVTTMLFQPFDPNGTQPWVRLYNCQTRKEMSENDYYAMIRDIYNARNPHLIVGDENSED